MEHIPGYGTWKTIPPEDPDPVYMCEDCGGGIFEGDRYYSVNGEILCEECMEEKYKRLA